MTMGLNAVLISDGSNQTNGSLRFVRLATENSYRKETRGRSGQRFLLEQSSTCHRHESNVDSSLCSVLISVYWSLCDTLRAHKGIAISPQYCGGKHVRPADYTQREKLLTKGRYALPVNTTRTYGPYLQVVSTGRLYIRPVYTGALFDIRTYVINKDVQKNLEPSDAVVSS